MMGPINFVRHAVTRARPVPMALNATLAMPPSSESRLPHFVPALQSTTIQVWTARHALPAIILAKPATAALNAKPAIQQPTIEHWTQCLNYADALTHFIQTGRMNFAWHAFIHAPHAKHHQARAHHALYLQIANYQSTHAHVS
jgi:hypothetical protein